MAKVCVGLSTRYVTYTVGDWFNKSTRTNRHCRNSAEAKNSLTLAAAAVCVCESCGTTGALYFIFMLAPANEYRERNTESAMHGSRWVSFFASCSEKVRESRVIAP